MRDHRASTSRRLRRLLLTVLLSAALLALAAGPALAVDRLAMETPLVSPPDAEARERVQAVVEKAVVLANRTYERWIEVLPPGSTGDAEYRVSIVAALGDNPALALTLLPTRSASPGKAPREQHFALLEYPGSETVHYLARAVFFLWASAQEPLRRSAGQPPQLIDELPVDALADSLLPAPSAALVPMAAAVSGQGTLFAGLSVAAVELDRSFRIVSQPGRSLVEKGAGGFAQSLAATPQGTVYLKEAMGTVIYRLSPGGRGGEGAQALRLRGATYGPLAALPDGSVALLDTLNRRLWRSENQRLRELPLGAGPSSWPTSMAAGPEGTLWVYYPVERRIKVQAPGGELLDSVLPLSDYDQPIEATAMAVYPDGRFLLYGRQGLACFDRLGLPLWRMEELPALAPSASGGPLPQPAALAVDAGSGIIYLADTMGRRILQLLDLQYCRDQGLQPARELRLLELNERQRSRGRDAGPTVDKALLYEQAGAAEMARVQWERALEIDPGDRRARDGLEAAEHALARAAAGSARDRTLRALEQFGRETARPTYQEAMRLYERLVARFPQDAEAREAMSALARRFEGSGSAAGTAGGAAALSLEQVEAENLFPALMHRYHHQPVLRLRVRNRGDGPLQDLRAQIMVERFMDFPWKSDPVDLLAPGAETAIVLKVPLNARVLELEEDLPVQGQIELSCRQGAAETVLRRSVGFTIHRRTALRWDDSGKLASFITPNEGVVSSFALGVARSDERPPLRFSERLLRAMRICDALGAYGVRYVEDPDSPVSRTLGRPELVDTVRFPRQTLQLRSGDCDDTTALLASLLEAAGIRTAVITTPGHVLLAFDTGESPSAAWVLEGPDRAVLRRSGGVWLPVETTALAEGFLSAWSAGSRLCRRHEQAGEMEFLPLRDLRERYPPIPLPESRLPVVEPSAAEIARFGARTLQGLQSAVYGDALAAAQRQLANAGSAAEAARLANRIGIVQAVFGRDREAAESFRSLLRDHPGYQPASLNLATLLISRGELPGAEEVLREALRLDGDSPSVNLLLAQLYERRGDRSRVREHFRVVQRLAPELAARYAYLGDPGQSEAARAGVQTGGPGAASEFWE